MKTKRLFCLLVCITLLLSACVNLVSCNDDLDEDPENTESQANSESNNKPAGSDKVDDKNDKDDQNADKNDGEDENFGDDENADKDNNDNNNDNNDDNSNNGGNSSTAESGSGSITKPSGGSQIPTPGQGTLENDGDPAINEFDVASYDLAKYMYPIWKTDISYAESTFVCEYTDNSNLEFQLLYPISEIVSVRSADLQTLYKEGVDYQVVNGNIKVLKTGSIPILTYENYFRDAATYKDGHLDIKDNSKAYFYDEIGWNDPGMSRYTIAITYRHTGNNPAISVPDGKSSKFTNLINKINRGEDIQIVALGDSITDGWSSSAERNLLPGCPSYHNMVTEYIRAAYGVNVTNTNLAFSGKSSAWALSTCSERGYVPIDEVCRYSPDLVILAFGMNDGTANGVSPSQFLSNINSMINTINSKCPNACIVVVGTQLANPQLVWKDNKLPFLNYHDDYSTTLRNAESSWRNAAFADATTAHMEMIHTSGDNPNIAKLNGRKSYEDTAGSNSNHPNDYFHRVYAQVVVQTIFGEFALYNK